MNASDGTLNPRREEAVRRCQEMIGWYETAKRTHRILYQTFQTLAVILSGLTPILILWDALPKAVQALPAALAAVFTAILGIFQWRETYTRFAYTAEALKSELVKYQTRTTAAYNPGVGGQQALDNFVAQVELLLMNEVTGWQALMQRAKPPADGGG